MRILLVTSHYLPKLGGVQLAVHNLAEGLCEAGHEVHLLAPKRRGADAGQVHALHTIHWFAPPPLTGLLGLRIPAWRHRLNRLVRRLEPEVVHAHVAYPAGLIAANVCDRIGIPFVLTCHGDDIQKLPEIGYGMRLDPHLDRLISDTVRRASGLIAIGSDVRAEYLELGVSPSRIADLPNGINASLLARRDPQAKGRLGLPQGPITFLAVGRNHPKKGFSFLIDAMKVVAEQDSNMTCVIVGARVPDLQPQVDLLNLTDKVFLFGPAPPVGVEMQDGPGADQPHTDAYFHAADCFVMPSLIESFGLVTVEAFAAGLPVVAMDAEGSRDILSESHSRMLVEDRDPRTFGAALLEMGRRIRENPDLGRENRLLAERYDRRQVAKRHVDFYRQVSERASSERSIDP
ncbi:glycosyltransferase family 4 protein [Thiocapsa roseopersicina]|uniref:Glycosyltransferase involved in cell wall bisynthesis n=1 Tax=Thiocapsa roseopersicina TaxID=1058 RepID=A0A1H2Y527_THIRO|nr:glycosyltransferase family 4 protein [Thiocapsa roseopersicina]SDW99689.1 Glycosyltransferase involved in cell wall bisynthesis [Thiocapsa roseopersicina]